MPYSITQIDVLSPEGFIMPLVYGLQALMERVEVNGNTIIRWKEGVDPMTFLNDNLAKIVNRYKDILPLCDYDPQKLYRGQKMPYSITLTAMKERGTMEQKLKKRMAQILTIILSIAVIVGCVPYAGFPVYAEDGSPALQLAVNGSADNIKGKQASSVWFGHYKQTRNGSGGYNNEPVKWKVLQNSGGKLFLLADRNLDLKLFNDTYSQDVNWKNCSLRTWLNEEFMQKAFDPKEQTAIAETSHYAVNWGDDPDERNPGTASADVYTSEKIFLLDVFEAKYSSDYGFSSGDKRKSANTAYVADQGEVGGGPYNKSGEGVSDSWWLRAHGETGGSAAYVDAGGDVYWMGSNVDYPCPIKPALNLDLSYVLFTSAADGKSSGPLDADSLTEVGTAAGSEWKLTLKGGHDDFEVDSGGIAVDSDSGEVTVPYSGAVAEDNGFISAVITDKKISDPSAKIKYYGRLKKVSGASGKVTIRIAGKMERGDKLYVFNEQYNGERETDFSSSFKTISIPEIYTVAFTDGQGKTLKTEEVESGNAATAPADPSRDGYMFEGWDKDFSSVTEDMTVTAQWEKIAEPEPEPEPEPAAEPEAKPETPAKTEPAPQEKSKSVTPAGAKSVTPAKSETVTPAKSETKTPAKSGPAAKTKSAQTQKIGGDMIAKLTAKGKKSLAVSWTRVRGAEGYDIFLVQCKGKNSFKRVKSLKGNKRLTWTKKGLRRKTAYKAYVKAWVKKNGKKTYIKKSPTVHAYTSGYSGRYTNPKSVVLKKKSVSLKKGKSYKIKAKVKKLRKRKKLIPNNHAPKLRYLSTNTKVATVSKSGRIKAKTKGSCYVYVFATNGAWKKLKVNVR